MNIEDVVENLNRVIFSERETCKNNDKSFLILHKTITPHRVIKAIKEINMTLWLVNPSKSIKDKIFTINKCARILAGQEDKIIEEVSRDIVYRIFQFVRTENFNDIVNGKYRNESKEISA